MTQHTDQHALDGLTCLESAATLEAMIACPFDADKLAALLGAVSLEEARSLRPRIAAVLAKLDTLMEAEESALRTQHHEISRTRRHVRAGLTYLAAAKL
jgi:hypothetical protein